MGKKKELLVEAKTKPVAEMVKTLVRNGMPVGQAVAAALSQGADKQRPNPPKNFSRGKR